jgi:hypothetical protein
MFKTQNVATVAMFKKQKGAACIILSFSLALEEIHAVPKISFAATPHVLILGLCAGGHFSLFL